MIGNPESEFLERMRKLYGEEETDEESQGRHQFDTHMTEDEFQQLLDERYTRGKPKRNSRFGS